MSELIQLDAGRAYRMCVSDFPDGSRMAELERLRWPWKPFFDRYGWAPGFAWRSIGTVPVEGASQPKEPPGAGAEKP